MRGRWHIVLYFAAALGVLASISAWLYTNGYTSSSGLQRWAEAITVVDATEDVAQALMRSFPWLSFLLLASVRSVFGSLPVWFPVAISNVAGAAILTVFFISLVRQQMPLTSRVFLPLAILVHPLFLWPVTSGDSQALQLLLFLGLTRAAIRVAGEIDARSLMTMATFVCLLLLADGRSVYVLLALFLLIPFLLPLQAGRDSAIGGYMIVFLPLAMSLSAIAYVGWVAVGDPLFLYRTALGHNAPHEAGERWFAYGPALPFSLAAIPLVAWICFPVIGPGLRAWTGAWRASAIMAAAAAIAALLAHADGALPHPAAMLFFAVAPWTCVLALSSRRALLAAVSGTVAAWVVFAWLPTDDMQSWSLALRGRTVPVTAPATAQLGQWLAHHHGKIIADDRFLAPALAVRGHAREMVLPGSASFRLLIRGGAPSTDWVVMTHPSSERWALDRVAQRYREGLPGYRLAWQNNEWQVYQKTSPLPITSAVF